MYYDVKKNKYYINMFDKKLVILAFFLHYKKNKYNLSVYFNI